MLNEEPSLSFFVLRNTSKITAAGNEAEHHTTNKVKDIFENYSSATQRRIAQTGASLFKNFENVRLTDEERVFLNAASVGDYGVIRQSLDDSEREGSNFNVDCVDYMGRSALHLAVDSENSDVVDILLDKLSFDSLEEALLHAISKGHIKIVKLIIEHPNFMAQEERIKRMDYNAAFFRSEDRSQFSPDITPLVLAAHCNNHEIIQMFLARGHRVEKPHAISCQCSECQLKQKFDSLKRSRSRLNAYRALANPAYMALANRDPISYTFELRQEMMKLAQVEKEFKNEYLSLVDQCMSFACELVDLCRGTQEVEAVLGEDEYEHRDPLRRLKLAVYYEEKKFVAHPNIQQHLTTLWYGSEMAFMQGLSELNQIGLILLVLPALPFLCIAYIIAPHSKVAKCLRCPTVRFATSTISYVIFVALLLAATLQHSDSAGKDDNYAHSLHPNVTVDGAVFDNLRNISLSLKLKLRNLTTVEVNEMEVDSLLNEELRSASQLFNSRHWLIILWVLGLLQFECKQLYLHGVKIYMYSSYNFLNFIVLSLYVASLSLRFIVVQWIALAGEHLNVSQAAYDAVKYRERSLLTNVKLCEPDASIQSQMLHYFVGPDRFDWAKNDPEIMSDVLFAIANVLSIAKASFVMPAFELLGPLQISFGRMLGDITRFMVLFLLVVFAFTVGIHNLYWYYGSHTVIKDGELRPASEPFEDLIHTLYTLFWCMFGQLKLESLPIKTPVHGEIKYGDGLPVSNSSTTLVESVGIALIAIYHVMIIIVLVNMLIAMMSHSFEKIQKFTDVEWKFARTKLWMTYMESDTALPIPLNLIPTPRAFINLLGFFREVIQGNDEPPDEYYDTYYFVKQRREEACLTMKIPIEKSPYNFIMQRLVRRYLFKLERQRLMEDSMKDNRRAFAVSADARYDDEYEEYGAPSLVEEDGAKTSSDSIAPSRRGARDETTSPANRRRIKRATSRRARGIALSASLSACGGPPQTAANSLQVLNIPQLDAIQRTQKIVDMRLQHLQSQCEAINISSGSHKIKEDIEHVRELISENQKAVGLVVRVIAQIQDQIRILSENMQQWNAAAADSSVTFSNIGSGKDELTAPPGFSTISRKASERSDRATRLTPSRND